MRRRLYKHTLWALVAAVAATAGTAFGETVELAVAVPQGEYISSPALGVHGERLSLPPELLDALVASGAGDRLIVASFPTAPGYRSRVELERVVVYASATRVWVVDGGEPRRLPRSRRVHYRGVSPDDPTVRLALSVDPRRGTLRGAAWSSLGEFQWREPESGETRHLLEDGRLAELKANRPLSYACGTEELAIPAQIRELSTDPPPFHLKMGGLKQAVVAVDTDNELLDQKFGNDTAEATDWLADLFNEMNVMYERDLELRLLQGETFLRLGTDPWEQSSTSAQLSEFGGYWASNMGAVERVFAMLLSGKAPSDYQSAGIAWLDGYCENQSTGGGYSVTQVFKANLPVTTDIRVIGHEIGHNAGSPHTHCYSPPVDQCYRAQGGCYSGAVSCPVGGKGTLMSYCHFSAPNGAACGSNLLEIHPTVQTLVEAYIDAHFPGCVEDLVGIFSDGFESGDTTAWTL